MGDRLLFPDAGNEETGISVAMLAAKDTADSIAASGEFRIGCGRESQFRKQSTHDDGRVPTEENISDMSGVVGCFGVHFNDNGTAPFGIFRDEAGRHDFARRPDEEKDIREFRFAESSHACVFGNHFTEKNEIRFINRPAATARGKHGKIHFASRRAGIAGRTEQLLCVAMELDDVDATRFLMEVVDILRDDGFQHASPFQRCQSRMRIVGSAVGEEIIKYFADDMPGIRWMLAEIRQIETVWIVATPQPFCTAKGRDTAFDGNTRTGERGHMAGITDTTGSGGYGHITDECRGDAAKNVNHCRVCFQR
jgi:hypothetical protein